PGLADSIVKLAGDLQSDTVNRNLTVTPQIQVVDRHGNGVPVTRVVYVTTVGNGAPISDSLFTDLSGNAPAGYHLGTIAGPQAFEARARNGAVVATFTADALNDRPTVIAKTGGDAQADTANAVLATPLSVHVTDAYGNASFGTQVAFTVIAGGG